MEYTVHQLAKIAGVSVRTLHFYDQIHLLKPAGIKENGYRYYEEKELLKLQQIMFFRELDFSIKEIGRVMNDKDFDMQKVLTDQKNLLEIKKERLETLIETINKTREGGGSMNNDDLFAGFDDAKQKEYAEEAKQRWGDTDAYKQSTQRVAKMSKQDLKNIEEKNLDILSKLAQNMDKQPGDPIIQGLIKQYHDQMNVFYDCPKIMLKNLSDMHISDPRFRDYYDKIKVGLVDFLHEAIKVYCTE